MPNNDDNTLDPRVQLEEQDEEEEVVTFAYDATIYMSLLYTMQRATAWTIVVVVGLGTTLLAGGIWVAATTTNQTGAAVTLVLNGLLLTAIGLVLIPSWWRKGRLRQEYRRKIAKWSDEAQDQDQRQITLDATHLWYDPSAVRLDNPDESATRTPIAGGGGVVGIPLSSIREVRVQDVTASFEQKYASQSCGSRRLARFFVAPMKNCQQILLYCDPQADHDNDEEAETSGPNSPPEQPQPPIIRILHVQDPYRFQVAVQQRLQQLSGASPSPSCSQQQQQQQQQHTTTTRNRKEPRPPQEDDRPLSLV